MPYGAQQRFGCTRDIYRCLCILMLLSFTVVLSGCGNWLFGESSSSSQSSASTQNVAPAPPGSTLMPGDPNAPTDATAPSYVSNYVDPLLEAGPLELRPDGSLGSLGLNLDTYFAHNLDGMHTNEARIGRIENVLSAMQKDLRRMAPPIQRLISIESDIRALVTQLSQLAEEEPEAIAPPTQMAGNTMNAPPASSAPMAVAPVTPPQTGGKAVPAAANGTTVNRVRIGEHKDKTRIVLDVSGPASYRYDLDNGENLLVIELPGTSWSALNQWQGKKSPLLASYSAAATGSGGSRLVIQLRESASVINESVIQENCYPDYRIVIDVKGSTIHQ